MLQCLEDSDQGTFTFTDDAGVCRVKYRIKISFVQNIFPVIRYGGTAEYNPDFRAASPDVLCHAECERNLGYIGDTDTNEGITA
ncbi:hypothetical protein D3C75_805290 [compost metagenome]